MAMDRRVIRSGRPSEIETLPYLELMSRCPSARSFFRIAILKVISSLRIACKRDGVMAPRFEHARPRPFRQIKLGVLENNERSFIPSIFQVPKASSGSR